MSFAGIWRRRIWILRDVGGAGGPVELWSDRCGWETQRQQPGTKEKGWVAECMPGRGLGHLRKMEANASG